MRIKKHAGLLLAGAMMLGLFCSNESIAGAQEASGPSIIVSPTETPAPSMTPEPAQTEKPHQNKKISISNKTAEIGIGESVSIALNNAGTDETVVWTSSDESVATVDSGKVCGISEGKTVICAKYKGKKYTCRIRVGGIGLDTASYEMRVGENFRLHVNGVNKKVRWSVKGKKILTVSKAYKNNAGFKALKTGTAVITAKAGNKVYRCAVKVVKKEKSVIYLTFDDGPSLTSTPKVLDILKKNSVNATFFVINYDKKGEKLIKRAHEEGNAIAIHGYSHDYGAIYCSENAYMNNILKMQNKLYDTLGYKVWITRFPGGSSNLVSRHYKRGIMTRLVKKADENGFAYFDWNVSSGDAGGSINSAQVYRSVISGLKKNRDNVVLMHDFSNNTKTIGALESIIKYGKAHGYVFKTISASTNEVHHGVQN